MQGLTLKVYKRIFNSYYTKLCLVSNSYVNDMDVSKDVVQEVFIKLWEGEIVYINDMAIKSFLYTAVRNKSLDYLKSSRVKLVEGIDVLEFERLESESNFNREVILAETSIKIEKAINALPQKCAQVIRLSLQEYSNAQIAENLNVSINTVKTQKKIAYTKLRHLLNDYAFYILLISTTKID